jgi:hypothetical protein
LFGAPPGDKRSVVRIALSLNNAPPPVNAGKCKL